MLLAAHLRRAGRAAIYAGGALQLHFGVKGRRWDYAGSPYRHVMQNPHWVWPLPSEKPPRAKTIDGSAYWA